MLHALIDIFWIVPAVGQIVVAVAIIRRKLVRALRMFLAYACWEVLWACVLYLMLLQNPRHLTLTITYFIAFWSEQAVGLILGVVVVKEVFSNIFQPYAALQDLSDTVFRWLIVILVLLALISGVIAPGVDQYRIVAGVYVLERSVRAVQVGVLLFLFVFSRVIGVSWRSHLFGIAAGFGLLATVRLIAVALRAQMGFGLQHLAVILSGAGETCAVLIWVAYLLIPEPAHELNELPVVQLEEWNQALVGLLRR